MAILIVDDEKELRETLKNALESEGYDVITADNGLAGLTLAQEKKPELILLDISMPVMDGFTALFKLKQNPITREIPVIILTGQYVDEENLERGFNLGAVEYLYKPIRFTELVARVKSVLRMRSLENEAKKVQLMTEKFFISEVKELFSSIRGIIEMILEGEEIGEEMKNILRENYNRMRKWFELSEYFIRLNDISAGVEEIEIKVFDINLLLKKVAEQIREKFSGVNFEFSFGRDSLVKGNENWIEIGFLTFFEAIAEAMSFNGKIHISQVTRAGSDGKFVFVGIRDEAKKLTIESAKTLFSPYLFSEYKPSYNLFALKIFQRIIELNGGHIIVEPSEQVGNKFVIRFHSA
ncbi:Response regulator receiver domain-containing protein [Candidatus Kryptobacter tengchongensis]|nr:Response regulator receiver domain-containing protein [Candidatus Kryptobacter tengchongensis]CUU02499.1 Response regulator receiver domain-containing protein [Candidatus Kryptobacter tengchongensis]